MKPESTERSEEISEKINELARSKDDTFNEFKRKLVFILSLLNKRMDSLENMIETWSKIREL